MSVASKIKKRSSLFMEILRQTPYRRILRQIDRNSDTIVWLHHRYPDSWLKFLATGDSILKDVALLAAVADAGIKFRIVSGPSIGPVTNSTIIYSIDRFNPAGVVNYSAGLVAALRELESQGNTLYPSADEAEYWENKAFMHRQFDALGIHAPKTVLLERGEAAEPLIAAAGLAFPLLVKEPHSCNSAGLHTVDSFAELEALRTRLESTGQKVLIVQEILDMRRDLRATVIGGEVVHHYFRINTTDTWMPTTTRRGSQVDFVTFPEQWRGTITGAMEAMGMRNGAFDICWDGDDLTNEPYFLEVSPAYTPNPAPPASLDGQPYADFKARLVGDDSFARAFVSLVFELHELVVKAWGIGNSRSNN
ncbi:MAG TPA: hypothetical protein DEG43_10325 [Acidimicrobiaceae bacterium]|nr:hypothetical protein [Acidimicrobiaceae bacterium]